MASWTAPSALPCVALVSGPGRPLPAAQRPGSRAIWERRVCGSVHGRACRWTPSAALPDRGTGAPALGERLRAAALATVASAALMLGTCDAAEAARSGGRFRAHRTHASALRARLAAHSAAGGAASMLHGSRRFTPPHFRVPLSVRLRALGPAGHLPPLPLGDVLAYPDLAAGLDLEALPLWASLLGLVAANVAGLALTLAVLRGLQDASEPVTLVKVQVAMLERQPHLQSKLSKLNSMIQVGQQGAWLILEEAILELLQHQSRIAYASVSSQQLGSKSAAYAAFGEAAEAEAAKANREEAVVRHMGETTDEDFDGPPASFVPLPPTARPSGGGGGRSAGGRGGRGDGGGLWQGLLSGLGGGAAAKEVTVVTLILATRGKLSLPATVADWKDLRGALQQLTGLSSDRLMAIELLWTPRAETDYLTRQQLETDYPNLRPLAGAAGQAGAVAK